MTAQQIVDKTIVESCNGGCDEVHIEFNFRKGHYISERRGGAYWYERITRDSVSIIKDILTNDGFNRYINDTLVQVPDTMVTRYSNSVNSVHYFVQLPYLLNDGAVNKELLGETLIKRQPYYQIGVNFDQKGGGTDFQDHYVYWIHKENFTMDYLAYSYATDESGIRFREAYNVRTVEGIRFADYNNYKPNSLDIELTSLPSILEKGELKLLSKIETENVKVLPVAN